MKFILAKKLGMTTIYSDGIAKNVTLLQAGKNVVSQLRTEGKDGYSAVQVGMVDDKGKGDKITYSVRAEFKPAKMEGFEIGQELGVAQFEVGEKVKVVGVSKGKGFQGVMKRHGFHGSPASHGHRHDHRAPGSIGCAFPERVFPGKKMAGRMGGNQVTTKNIAIAQIDEENKILAIKGAVPGNNGAVVQVIRCD